MSSQPPPPPPPGHPPSGQSPQGQPPYGQPPYGGQPPGHGQPPYGQAPPPYGQAPPGQPPYGQPPPYGDQPGYPPPGGGKSRTGLVALLIVLVLVVAGGAVAAVLLLGGDDEDTADDGGGGSGPSGQTIEGDGYAYALPESWHDVSGDIPEQSSTQLVDTVSASGETMDGANANVIVEVSPSRGATSPDDLRSTWESNISRATGATPSDIEGKTFDGEEAIGVSLRYTNQSDVEVVQLAYLVLHEDQAFSVTLSTVADAEEASTATFDELVGSWSWQ